MGLLGVKTSLRVLENVFLSIPSGVLQLSRGPLEDKLKHDLLGPASRIPSPVKVLGLGAKNLQHLWQVPSCHCSWLKDLGKPLVEAKVSGSRPLR